MTIWVVLTIVLGGWTGARIYNEGGRFSTAILAAAYAGSAAMLGYTTD